jgi:hypothetical protein
MNQGVRAKAAQNRVIRGGSWNNTAQNARSAYRNRNHPGNRNNNLGFRPASPSHRQIAGVARPCADDPGAVQVTARPRVLVGARTCGHPAEHRSARRGS